MSTYRKIHGRSIQAVTTDPTESVAEGQVWYNTTSDTFKSVLGVEAWRSSAPMITARSGTGGAGDQTAHLVFGGPPAATTTEEYNGSGWSTGGGLNTGSSLTSGTGTQTAGLKAGGWTGSANQNNVEEYNGTAWTAQNTLSTARRNLDGAGIQTSAAFWGGQPPGATSTVETEEYNGSSWTSGGNLNTARKLSGAAGSAVTALLAVSGKNFDPATTANVEQYDGTSWSEISDLNTARSGLGGGGTTTSALVYGGTLQPGPLSANAESWNGTSWSETSDLAAAVSDFANIGATTGTNAIKSGGNLPSATGNTEEFNSSANVITAGAWAAGGNLSTARTAIRGAGIQTAAWGVGGETGPGPTTNATENYDGTSWTGGGNFPTTTRNSFTYGTQAAGLSAGGNSAPGQTPYNTASAEYDGSSWTASPGSMSPGKGFGGSSGVQTSALATGGDGPPNPSNPFAQIGVQSYDGSTWSTETNYPTNIYGATGAGVSETAAVVWGGTSPYPGTPNPNTSDYNGSAWTVVAKSIVDVGASNQRDVQGTNQAPSALCGSMGGNSGAVGFYQWNDTAWSTLPNMGTGGDRGGAGTLTGAIAFGGYHPGTPRLAATEEFTPESTTLNVKTLTQS